MKSSGSVGRALDWRLKGCWIRALPPVDLLCCVLEQDTLSVKQGPTVKRSGSVGRALDWILSPILSWKVLCPYVCFLKTFPKGGAILRYSLNNISRSPLDEAFNLLRKHWS